MRLIHLTDPHLSHLEGIHFTQLRGKRWSGFASWHKNRRKKHLPHVLQQLCQAIKAENADQILLTGDLVQIGLASEIQQAANWLASLGTPEQVMLVPGNHDIYARDSKAQVNRLWGDYMFAGRQGAAISNVGQSRWPVIRKNGPLTVIGLSSAVVSSVFMATGRLDEVQLKALPGLLKQAREEGQLVALLIHHPPLPGMTRLRKSLLNAARLQEILAKQPPDLLFYGHLHDNREKLWQGARLYCTAAASSVENASYRVIDIEDKGEHYQVQMTLKAIAANGLDTHVLDTLTADAAAIPQPDFVELDCRSWEICKYR